jgi:hypothetical protein
MADNLEAAAKTRADRESLDVAISEMAWRFDANFGRLRRTVDRSRDIMEVSLDDDDPPDPPQQGPRGPRGPQGPAGPGVDPNTMVAALSPLFQDLGTIMQVGNSNIIGELQHLRREGNNPDEDMDYHGSSRPRGPPGGGPGRIRKTTRNVTYNRVEVNKYYEQKMNAAPPSQNPNTGAANDIDMVNPPGPRPPPDPDASTRVFAEMGRGFLDQFRQFAADTTKAQQAMAEQLRQRDLEIMAERHTAERDRRAFLDEVKQGISASTAHIIESVVPEVARATAAQTVAPDPRIEQLLRLYEASFERIERLMQQGFRSSDPDVAEALQRAHAEQARLAG